MTKVTLLGDSIRLIGYGKKVPSLCEGEFEIWQPGDNCRFALYTLRGMFDWAKGMEGSEIIHWNNGLWDICDLFGDGAFTRLDDYIDTMLRIARILKTRSQKVIFATTTPVRPANPYNRNAVIEEYNNAVVPELQKLGVEINDLYSLVSADIPRYIREDDNIHLTDDGIDLCAKAVLDSIRAAKASL